jgi:hypothetical protein
MAHTRRVADTRAERSEIALSVIMPVYDREGVIVENVRVVRERAAAGLDVRGIARR